MNKIDFSLNLLEISEWFNIIRNSNNRDRLLDAMYYGQLTSKAWIVTIIEPFVFEKSSIYIFGGWVGILPNMLFKSSIPIELIYNIDIDPWATNISKNFNKENNYYISNDEATQFQYPTRNNIIAINTITEHLTQEQYQMWYNNIPLDALIVIQGNNLFEYKDHVRCSNTLEEFLTQNNVPDTLYEGEIEFAQYKRYMAVWRKNELY